MFQALLMGGGLAMQAYGAFQSNKASKQAAAVNQQIAAQEQLIEAERKKQMILNSRRQQTENIRNAQLARSMSLTSATSQGGQQGSGYFGGQAQITGTEGYNALGIRQNTQIGESVFGANSLISGYKQQLAALGSDQATAQGFSQFGGNLMSAGTSFGGNPFMTNKAPAQGFQNQTWAGSSNKVSLSGWY